MAGCWLDNDLRASSRLSLLTSGRISYASHWTGKLPSYQLIYGVILRTPYCLIYVSTAGSTIKINSRPLWSFVLIHLMAICLCGDESLIDG
ncbi:hypothetical protein VTN77DRAFT_7908 [Rasamsonia byssochlamydoides]|uniref:uncharacterized protein n=1 Tax=Rasamsonia byssochlamydoides TaxID=89139 RepID=UPI003743130B